MNVEPYEHTDELQIFSVHFDEDEIEDLRIEEITHILVTIDADETIELSGGYDPASRPGREEQMLFDEHKSAIKAAVLTMIKQTEEAQPDSFVTPR